MATDCEKLSKKAQKVFEKLREFYPLDSWKKPQWIKCGIIRESNTWYDLRKHADRQKLIEWHERVIGHSLSCKAEGYIKEHGSISCFYEQKIGMMIQKMAELLVILNELDFQIETGDLVD